MQPTDPRAPPLADLPTESLRWTLAEGTAVGPYVIDRLVGRGGMGEVYSARDPRLGRQVAVKVLPAGRHSDAEALRRFEIEAHAAATINHPNVVAIYDTGVHEGMPFVISELLEGETLRARLQRGPIPETRAVELARQMALGLAAAHEKGVTHRDLKPENLFVTVDGHAKILDFGVAKLAKPDGGTGGFLSNAAVVGTTAYMSPEQVRGQSVDRRSDIFSLGIVLFEMIAGHRPFGGQSSAEMGAAILAEEPQTLAAVTPGLRDLVSHCLEKAPTSRFQSAGDLAFAMQSLDHSTTVRFFPRSIRLPPWIWKVAAAALIGVGLFAAGWRFAPHRGNAARAARFQALTFQDGWFDAARFVGSEIVYQAHFADRPDDLYLGRPGSPEARPLGLPPHTALAAVSASGDVAVLLDAHPQIHYDVGTLALVPIGGGEPRPLDESIVSADFSPDGKDMAVVRYVAGSQRLEYPRGKKLFETPGAVLYVRVSPRGDRVAFDSRPDGVAESGHVVVLDLTGREVTHSRDYAELYGVAWNGDEVWFSAGTSGAADTVFALASDGSERAVQMIPGALLLLDAAPGGRVLFTERVFRHHILYHQRDAGRDRDVSLLDQSELRDLTTDGKRILIVESGHGGGADARSYLRGADGGLPVLLGSGNGTSLSPDGAWLLRASKGRHGIDLVPTGAGEERRIALEPLREVFNPAWFPDGKRMVVTAVEDGHGPRIYVLEPDGKRRPISPDGIREYSAHPVSPDGKWVAGYKQEGVWLLVPVDGGEPQPVAGLENTERIAHFTGDGRVVVFNAVGVPCRVSLLDPASGKRELLHELFPPTPSAYGVRKLYLTPDGGTFAYSVLARSETLYLGEGL